MNINAIHQPITSSSPKMNIPVMTLAEAKSRMSSVPRISIPSEKYPKHTYIFQRLQHIYKATPPYTYFNCLSCKRLCAKWQNSKFLSVFYKYAFIGLLYWVVMKETNFCRFH